MIRSWLCLLAVGDGPTAAALRRAIDSRASTATAGQFVLVCGRRRGR